jgi:hypothetical protein
MTSPSRATLADTIEPPDEATCRRLLVLFATCHQGTGHIPASRTVHPAPPGQAAV